MKPDDKLMQNLLQELKRGSLVLAVLMITRGEAYGYSLVQDLQRVGVDVEQNTLYPLLRRLETQGLMESVWNTADSRPRKYYRVTEMGRATAALLADEWRRQHDVMNHLMEGHHETD